MFTRSKVQILEAKLKEANERLAGVEALQADRAALVSIVQQGRLLRFTFARNGVMTIIETYAALESDVPGWRRALLERQP